MLLYHFPLTSNSATPNLENKGLKSDYTLESGWTFEQEGKLSSYCARTNKKSLIIPISGDFSLCFRVKSNIVQTNWGQLFALNSTNSFVMNYYNSNNFNVYASIGGEIINNLYAVDDNQYHDVIVTRRNGVANMYLDNINIGADNSNDATLILFCAKTNPQRWDCYIQDIRIYDYVLSQQEIKDYSKALVLHYPLNGSELGNTIKDVSGFGNDGRIVSDVRYVEVAPRGLKSLYKVGAPQEDRGGAIVCNLSHINEFTVSVWIKSNHDIIPSTTIKNNNILKFQNSGYGSNATTVYYENRIDGLSRFAWGSPFTRNPWVGLFADFDREKLTNFNLLTFVAKSDKTILYVNGKFTIEQSGVLISDYLNRIAIGTYNDWQFSDFRIYASAISESDIKALYNQPISLGNSLNAIELSEPAKYKSFAWRTPTYAEMNYIISNRPNASNLKGLGRVNVNGTYINGCFILPDDFVAPEGVTFTPTAANFTTNSYTLEWFRKLEGVGVVFMCAGGRRNETTLTGINNVGWYWLGNINTGNPVLSRDFYFIVSNILIGAGDNRYQGNRIRLVRNSQQGKFSTSATTKIEFAHSNLQYHCTKHIWRFAENQYDFIGLANANISDTYNGWIDLFGYGTSGKNYSPTLHSINNADYASGDISGTDNDWGVNEITTSEHEEKNIKLYKSGVITANEISEGDTNEFTANSIQVTKLKED